MKIKNITVVGGGTSGWMVASALNKHFTKFNVTLVESPNVPTVGVGESTLLLFNEFLRMVDLKDEDWMKECDATYKNNIRFVDFKEKGHTFNYPFGGDRGNKYTQPWTHIQSAFSLPTGESYCEFCTSHNYFLSQYNRNTKDDGGVLLDFNFDDNTAYHLDAVKFAHYLRKNCCDRVEHYQDTIVGVEKDDEGYITKLIGEDDEFEADLFIDCTGFKSILLEKEMGSKFISYDQWLSNDSAIAAHVPYTDRPNQMRNSTTCTGLSSGWVWNVPTWSRMGSGYVYSSKFIDDETAEKEFREHVGIEDLEVRKVPFRHGVHQKGWIKNVCAVGLSYGFVEPLESTALNSTLITLKRLGNLLSMKEGVVNGFDIDGFNYACQAHMDNFLRFVALHYKLTSRDDTPYWRAQQDRDWFDIDTTGMYEHMKPHGVPLKSYERLHFNHTLFNSWPLYEGEGDGTYYIMAGMGYSPYGDGWVQKTDNLQHLYDDWRKKVEASVEYVKTLPTSYEFMKQTIYG